MVTWMIHPKHGAHPAVGGELEGLKANGWTVRPPKNAQGVAHEALIGSEHIDAIKKPLEKSFEEAPRVKRTYNRKAK
jgi:hypothetical protein